jgi:hypothetical protein
MATADPFSLMQAEVGLRMGTGRALGSRLALK